MKNKLIASILIFLHASQALAIGQTTPQVLAAKVKNGSGTLNVNSSGTITVPNGTDTLVGKATTDTLTNKSISGSTNTISNVGPTQGGTGLSTYTTGDLPYASSANTLSKLAVGTSGQFLKVSGGAPAWGAGATGINYLSGNPDGEVNTTGWTTYDDAAAAPVDGTGGVVTTTWGQVAAATMRGSGYFLLSKDAANRQGEGVCYAFTLDNADKAHPLTINYDYEIVSGTYADGDLTDYIIDVTNSTVIQPSPYTIPSATAGQSQKRQPVQFQASATGSSYKYCIHVASTSASAYTVGFDNFNVSPTYSSYGAVATDWASFTPTGSWVSNTTYTGWWRRVGDTLSVKYKLALAGAPTAATLTVNLPTGLTIDTAKLPATPTNHPFPGGVNGQGAAHSFIGGVVYSSTTALQLLDTEDGSNAGVMGISAVTATHPYTFANGDFIYAEATGIPITGWSSNVQVSSDADTRVNSLKLTGSSTSITSSGVAIVPTTVSKDTHGSFSGSTYTCGTPGDYMVFATMQGPNASYTAGDTVSVQLVQAGGSPQLIGVTKAQRTTTDAYTASGAIMAENCKAGDTLVIKGFSTVTGNIQNYYASIVRVSGLAQVAATEKVRVKYINTAGTSITSSSATVPFATKVVDTHLAFNNATANTFVAPRPDFYKVCAKVTLQAVSNSTAQQFQLYTLVTATPESLTAQKQYLDIRWGEGVSHSRMTSGCTVYNMNQGDTVAIQADNANTVGLDTTAYLNVITIESQGGI